MLNITRATTLNGESLIDGQTALTMYANVPNNSSPTISQTITNKTLYLANQTECDNDYESFKNEVNKLLQPAQTITTNTEM